MNSGKRGAAWWVALGLWAAVGLRPAAADEPPYERTRDVVYGRKAGLALTMDVFRPKGKGNGAAVLWLCSGDWTSDIRGLNVPRLFGEYLGRGYTVFAVLHGSAPAFALDEIVPDVHGAVRHVRHHAREYGVDPDRLAILGISSGGHLAAHVGVSGGKGPPFPTPDFTGVGRYEPAEREPSRVAAFVSVCGPTDLLNYEAEGKSILEFRLPPDIRQRLRVEHFTAPFGFRDYHRKSGTFTPVTEEEVRRRLKALSPACLVSADSAPGLLIYGAKDTHVPVRQAEVLAARLKAAGVPVRLIVRPEAGHDVYEDGDRQVIADWLDGQLAARGPAGK
jgi:acetyl esterase/lipase